MAINNNPTSEFLRDCMAGAVMRLLEQWPLDKIQVKQICDVSGYHRASWFRAFRSKSEAVTYHMVRLWQQYCERHNIVVRDDFNIDNAEAFFHYNFEIRDTLRLIYRRGLMPELAKSFTDILHDHHTDDHIRAYHAAMFSFILYGILREWIIRDFKESPSEMVKIFNDAFVRMA